jgi:type III secretion protein Q
MPNAHERWDPPMPLAVVPERLAKADAALQRRLSRRRVVNRPIEGQPCAFVFSLALAVPEAGIEAVALVDDERIRLHLPLDLAQWVVWLVEPSLAAPMPLDPDRALLLVDLALSPIVEALAQALGVGIGALEPAAFRLEPDTPIMLAIDIHTAGGRRGRALIGLPRSLAGHAADLLEAAQPLAADFADLPMPVSFRIGDMSLSLAELQALRPGDILLHDPISADRAECLTTIGETWLAPARVEGRHITLTGPFRAVSPKPELAIMSEYDPRAASLAGPGATADIDLDQLPVRLVFEAGRTELPLGALRTLGVGHVFELGRDAAGPIEILANGKRIGEGELVRIGDSAGIRIRQLFGHG